MYKKCLKWAIIGGVMTAAGFSLLVAMMLAFGYDLENILLDWDWNSGRSGGEYSTAITTTATVERVLALDMHDEPTEAIHIDVSLGRFTVTGGDALSVTTYGVREEYFECYFMDGELYVKYNPDVDFSLFDDSWGYGEVTITVPYNNIHTDIKIDMDAGELTMSDLHAGELAVTMMAGNAEFHNVNVYDSADIVINAGNVTYNGSSINALKTTLAAGNCYFDDVTIYDGSFTLTAGELTAFGTVMTGKSRINMTAGNVSLNLRGYVNDYRFTTSKTAGSIYIDGESDYKGNPSAVNSFDIKTTAGSCYINFDNIVDYVVTAYDNGTTVTVNYDE